jgi:hypothetical protein
MYIVRGKKSIKGCADGANRKPEVAAAAAARKCKAEKEMA